MTLEKHPSRFTLFILMALASVGAVLFTPAIPTIQKQFSVSSSAVQWTVSIFIIGYALGQLIYGPLANRLGRKPTLYLAILVAIAGSILCGISSYFDSFALLLIGRLIMAIGAASGLTLTFTIISDVYSTEEARPLIAYMTLAFAIFPGLAIFLGGFIVRYYSWEFCFYFLAVYYFFALVLCFYLPETGKGIDRSALRVSSILKGYRKAIKNLNLWVYTSMWGLCTAIIYIFAATAPLIVIDKMGLKPNTFGSLSLIVSAGLFLGGFVAGRINKKHDHQKIILLGTLVMLLGAVALYIFSDWVQLEPWSFFGSTFVIYFGLPLVFSNGSALAGKTVTDKASASSMMSFLNMMFAVVGLYLMGLVHNMPERIMPEVFLVIVALQLGLFVISRFMVRIEHT